jgi:phosphatidylinositol alpha-mannosyltransferase
MRDLIAREGLTGDVTLETGVTLEDVPRFLHEIDVLVQPSTQEGLGVVLLEAMASGVPIVANNCDGFREIATHNHNAYLTAGNDPALLVEAVSSVITDGELRARLARNGLTFVQSRHALDDMIDQTIALYREVIQHAGKP